MKKLFFIALIATITLSCRDVDNYATPECAIVGEIIDEYGDPLQLSVGRTNAVVRCVEVSTTYTNPDPIDIPLLPESKFANYGLFESTYKLYPYELPLVYDDGPVTVTTKPGEPQYVTFRVIPYLRIKLEIVDEMAYITITKPDGVDFTGSIISRQFMYGDFSNIYYNNAMTDDSNQTVVSVNFTSSAGVENSSVSSQAEILNRTHEIPLSILEDMKPGSYWFRFRCKIDGSDSDRCNYSEAVYATYTGPKAEVVEVVEFANDALKSYLISFYDADEDGEISLDEAETVTTIDVAGLSGITTLSDISYFTNLTTLDCSGTDVTEIDLSSNTALQYLDISDTSISVLDLSGCKNLTTLDVSNTSISVLDVSDCGDLETLDISNTSITTLDLSNCLNLQTISIEGCSSLTAVIYDSTLQGESDWLDGIPVEILVDDPSLVGEIVTPEIGAGD